VRDLIAIAAARLVSYDRGMPRFFTERI